MDYRDRIKTEIKELQDKTLKLVEFMFSGAFTKLSSSEQELLRTQNVIMMEYISILNARLGK